MEAFDSKGIINTLEKYYVSQLECVDLFRYVTDKILFSWQVYFDRSLPLKFSEYFSQF